MSLRERKIVRTRQRIVDVALDLMTTQGYDATTMEQIAEAAEVGSSTLYRYFPTKDRLATATFTNRWPGLEMSVRDAPAGTPLRDAVRDAMTSSLSEVLVHRDGVLAARALIDQSPVPRARLFDDLEEGYERLQEELADWADRDAEDLQIRVIVRQIVALLALALDVWTEHRGTTAIEEIVADIFEHVPPEVFDLPRHSD